ncbi:MAG: hypothetical protein F4Z07_06535 [Dehalococcoidia bacterium]|nr:hypothetical protein [Dehalococcoidia bacterium]
MTLTLAATDIDNASSTTTVSVVVRANQRPAVAARGNPATVNGGGSVSLDGSASDPEGDSLTYAWSSGGGGAFTDSAALDTTWTAPPKTNAIQNIVLTLTVTDAGAGARSDSASVDVTVRANQPPTASATVSPATVHGRGSVRLNGAARDRDDTNLTYRWTSDGGGSFDDATALNTTWTAPPARLDAGGVALTLEVTDPTGSSATATASVTVRANQAPRVTVSPAASAVAGDGELEVSGTAVDPEGDGLTYSWSSNGGGTFADPFAAQTTWTAPPETGVPQSITLTLTVTDDGAGARSGLASIRVAVGGPVPTGFSFGGGGGGGGGPSGPTPSTVDFEWTVKHDIEELEAGHRAPTGMWGDGATLWLLQNGDGTDDAVYAYELGSGEREEEREFALAERNRAPRGLWSDGETAWVSDSGRDRLFAYDLGSGERQEEREFALAGRNADARGIWSDGETMWVLDGGKNSLFAYALAGGDLLAEYDLAGRNGDPRGLWSDRVSIWVSDHGLKQLWAYRLPDAPDEPAAEDAEAVALERVREEDFVEPSRSSNNSPRGIWSDGAVMYVADQLDGKVYTYNMADAWDARLATLTLRGVDIGAFDPATGEYEGVVAEDVTGTTVEAGAVQGGTTVVIDPPDADAEAEGHQVGLAGLDAVTVTVTSADGLRTRTYRVRFGASAGDEQPLPSRCLHGDVLEGFGFVVFEGGSLEDLVVCAVSRNVLALYVLEDGVYVPYILDAPAFVNAAFVELFAGGVPPLTPIVVASDAPSAGAFPDGFPEAGLVEARGEGCLLGEVGPGFSSVVYPGGGTEALEACALERGVTALYALHENDWVPLILGAPDFVNAAFRELFPGGVPPLTPLIATATTQAGIETRDNAGN